MNQPLLPRNAEYIAQARILQADMETLLKQHPEAFDCIVFAAQEDQDEMVSSELDVVGSLESGERAQTYAKPVRCRALIAPNEEQDFGVLSSGLGENFDSAERPLALLLSIPGVRTYSLVQWLEYASPALASDEAVTARTVYVLKTSPIGHSMGAGVLYLCQPLPAMGEVPEGTVEELPPEELLPEKQSGEQPEEPEPMQPDLVGVL